MASKAPAEQKPYSSVADPGTVHFRRFMVAKVDGNWLEAYMYLREGAELGSPLCMHAHGLALVMGDVPGQDPDPTAIHWLDRAHAAGAGFSELGVLLVEGERVPRDTERGLRLLEQNAPADRVAAMALAKIYEQGLHGVPRDHEKAVATALLSAPLWRRVAARIGFPQSAWMSEQFWISDRAKEIFEGMTPKERRDLDSNLVRDMRSR